MRASRILLPVILLIVQNGMAQHDTLTLPFRTLTIEDGLSQGMVNSMAQDSSGFMWFATKDGLDRYDGYDFTVYRNDPNDSLTLAENYVSAVRCAPDGRLWVGTAGQGIQVFDASSETFTREGLGLANEGTFVLDIAFGADKVVWVATSTGLHKLVPRNGNGGAQTYRDTRVFDRQCRISVDRSGRVWGYLKSTAAFRITPGKDGPDRIDTIPMTGWTEGMWDASLNSNVNGRLVVDPASGRVFGIHPFFIAEYDQESLEPRLLHRALSHAALRLEPNEVAIDPAGGLWIGTNEFWYFNLRSMRLSRVLPADPNHGQMLNFAGVTAYDRNGLLWVATNGHGLLRYDPRIARFHNTPTRSLHWMAPLWNGLIIALQQDDVLCTYDPVSARRLLDIRRHDAAVVRVFPEPQDNVDAALQSADGNYWLCKGELVRYDPATASYSVIKVREPIQPGLTWRRAIFPLFAEGEDAFWYGNSDAIERYDRSTGRTTAFRYPIPPDFSTYSFLQFIHRDADGILWLGTLKGLLRLDPVTQQWTHYQNDPADPASLSSDVVFTVLADPKEPQRFLWLGTNGGGLNRFDIASGKVRRYTTAEGLPNNVVYGILSDARGDLWMSTNKGIARFTPSTGAFRNYGAADGLQSDEFNRRAYCKLPDGTLCFGGVKGFNWFRPADLVDDSSTAPIRITGIKLINHPLDFRDPRSPIRVPAHLSKGMRIPYSDNMVTFEFAIMDFAAPDAHHYRYKLEGFDRDWIDSGTDHSAVYTNLDPGTYTFRVLGDNLDGIWDTEGARFELVILPPWWRTWWAYAGVFLLVVGSVLLYIRSLRHRQVVLEETVQQRTHELIEAKARAEHSEQVKQQFLANMSHEIRTPMNAIMGMSAILERNAHPPEQDRYLHAIVQSSENLLVILNDILDLSKLEVGKITVEEVPFDPRAVLGNVRDILQFKAEEKGLLLTLKIDVEVPQALKGDPTRLQQVLINLAGNAIKFTDKGGVTMHATAHTLTNDRATLHIDVIDTGIGIAPEKQESIFEEFDQAYSDTSRKYGGTGLGLSISKRLVELQGGRISVRSEKGSGSTFIVEIPYRLAEISAQPTVTEGTGPELRDLRILLAEDNAFNAMVAQDELVDAIPGVHVDLAVNGREAVERARTEHYDVVLMDVQMPEMNGYEATRAIRQLGDEHARIPILAMTANVMKEELERCMEAGMDGSVPKPFKREELLEAIRAVLT